MSKPMKTHTPGTCSCGAAHEAHELAWLNAKGEQAISDGAEQAILHGLFPEAATRRALIKAIGAGVLLDAISSFLPLDTMKAMAQDKVVPEKAEIAIGMIPITCATPLVMAEHNGLFKKNGLTSIKFFKTGAPGIIRDKLLNGELDMSQQVMPVPITVSMGAGSVADLDNRDPKNWKGFRFGVPFEQSQHALVLRYFLAEHGLDPDQDVSFRVVPATEYVSNLRTGNIDGFYGGEPGGQRAVYEGAGYLHTLSRDLWQGHPCCAFTARAAWIKQYPNTFLAAYRAVVESSVFVSDPANRSGIAAILAKPEYLNQPEIVIEQVISGRYADGLGNVHEVKDRIVFNPYPHYSMAIWFMTQIKRWNMIQGDVNYKEIAEQVMLATQAKERLAELKVDAPDPYRTETIMGKVFDPSKPEEYIKSFKIRRV
jgi:nitrate/nitrite transport system substrate-binding protein